MRKGAFLDASSQRRRVISWHIGWSLAGIGVALLWLILDFAVIPSLGISGRENLDLMIALDYTRIFTWPTSLFGHYSSRNIAIYAMAIGAVLNVVVYLALGWIFRFCAGRDKRLILVPGGIILLWFIVVLNL